MVAASYLRDESLTFFALLDIRSILPALDLLLEGTLTRTFRVSLPVTSVTDES